MAYENKFSENVKKIILNAKQLADKVGDLEVASEHLLYGITASDECVALRMLNHYGVNKTTILSAFISSGYNLNNNMKTDLIAFTARAKSAFEFALKVSIKYGYDFIGTEQLLLGIINDETSVATRFLRHNFKIDIAEFKDSLELVLKNSGSSKKTVEEKDQGKIVGENVEMYGKKTAVNEKSKLPDILLEMGSDLTLKAREHKIDPIIGRKSEIERIVEILCRKTKNNPILIGEAGVGKSAVVEGLALAIAQGDVPEILKDKEIYCFEIAGLMAGTKYRGSLEEKLKAVIETIQSSKNIIVFIDEIHTLAMAGHKEGEVSPADILKPYLSRGELQTIGATTVDEYRKYIEKDKALGRRFQPIMVNPPSVDETILILKGLRDSYEAFHKIKITDEAIDAAAKLSDRYITDRNLPDKAIDLIDEAASRAKVVASNEPAEIKEIRKQIEKLEIEKNEAVISENFEKSSSLNFEIGQLKDKINKHESDIIKIKQNRERAIGEDDIARVVARWTGIPVMKLSVSDKERLMNLEEILHKRVIAQNEAISAVARSVRRARAGLKDPHRPVGSFLFLGPTGVGKTELSKALAEAMYDSENNIIRLDMSEYKEEVSVSKLVGSAPGYVGYDEGGQLTEQVRRKPHSIVLFDEIEKAHSSVYDMLLQILDEGKLTDSSGVEVNFKNTVIILTSNVGAAEFAMGRKSLGFSTGQEAEQRSRKDVFMDASKRKFKPELLNRIDDIVVFDSLTIDDIAKIATYQFNKLAKKLAEQNIKFKITESALKYIVKKGYSEEYGARPLKRLVQSEIEDKLADMMLTGKLSSGDEITVDEKNGELTFI